MKVLVTGGTGRLGRSTVEKLCDDYEVTVIARQATRVPEKARLIQADIMNLGQVYSVMAGKDAVVHLAATSGAIQQTPEVVFANNIMGVFNIAEAATNLGVKKVIYSSSCSAYGFAFGSTRVIPDYLPIDEQHPLRPQDPYGLSKRMGEDILEASTRRTGMTTFVLRIPFVVAPDWYTEVLSQYLARPKIHAIGAYVDARDFAQAVCLVLENDQLTGHHIFNIAAEDALSRVPLSQAFPSAFPGTEKIAANLTGTLSSVSIQKAKRMLGYQPRYSWRNLMHS